MLSSVVSQSYLAENEVFLTDYLSNIGREQIHGIKCIIFIRPTTANMELLMRELREPRYSEYHIFFTNILKNPILERIAEADEFGVVVCVREVFSDFYVLHKNHVNLKLGTVIGEQLNSWSRPSLSRAASGLSALLLCLHQRPVIRFDRSSLMANQLAHELDQLIESEGDLYQPCHTDSRPLVLVLDRRFDLITPLLLQWSYQAMVHDLFGIENGRVRVKDDNTGNTKEFVFSVYQDDFLKDNSDSSFGDLGANVRTLVQTFQGRTQLHQTQMDSLPSMKHFIEEYPEYRKMSFYVSKHVSLLGELSRKVESLQLLRISELQQIIATSKVNDAKLLDQISLFLQEEDICSSFKLNISILCALHHRRWPNFDFLKFVDILRRCGMSEEHVSIVDFILSFSLPDVKATLEGLTMYNLDGHGSTNLSNHDTSIVYTRHVPPIVDIVDAVLKGRLPISNYPFVRSEATERPQEIIVFMVNGTTYEEAYFLRKFNELIPGVSIILAGTTVHNRQSVIDEIWGWRSRGRG